MVQKSFVANSAKIIAAHLPLQYGFKLEFVRVENCKSDPKPKLTQAGADFDLTFDDNYRSLIDRIDRKFVLSLGLENERTLSCQSVGQSIHFFNSHLHKLSETK